MSVDPPVQIRNNNHEILKHPHDAGYYLVWYQGTLYYE